MSSEKIVITLFAKDRPGIVRALSNTVLEHQGNWLESSLSRLCGQFTGIVHIEIAKDMHAELVKALSQLADQGIHVTLQKSVYVQQDDQTVNGLQILVEANDRPGIVNEITNALAEASVNVDNMDTECESASMAGYNLFRAHLFLVLPEDLTEKDLEQVLEDVSDDLMVSILEE